MFSSRPAVHPLQVEAPAPAPAPAPAADPPADQQQQPQPEPEPEPQPPQPMHPQPQEPEEQAEQEVVELPQGVMLPQGVAHPPGVLMKDLPGMPGTPVGVLLRIVQLMFAGVSLSLMTSTDDFPTVTAFCFFVAGAILQGLWSFMLALVDVYALMVKRSLRNRRAVCVFAIGDVITGGITLCGACAAAAITVLIDNDLDICSMNHCSRFQSAVAMSFMCWFSVGPTCLMNLWSMLRRQ